MIKIIKGIYTTEAKNEAGIYETKTPASAPFVQSPAKEAELVELGVAEYVEQPEKKSEKPAESAAAGKKKKTKEDASES